MPKKTTIAIDVDVQKELDSLRKSKTDTYNTILKRLIQGITDVYTEFVLIDNELPQLHTVVFQLGTDPESLYFYDGKTIQPIMLQDTQKLMKQPKPNMTITKEEVDLIIEHLCSIEASVEEQHLRNRLNLFLEQTK